MMERSTLFGTRVEGECEICILNEWCRLERRDVTYSAEENFFGGADVAIGMNGMYITFSWYSIFDYSYDGRHAYQGEDGVFYVKRKLRDIHCHLCPVRRMVQESHTAQKMAWLVGNLTDSMLRNWLCVCARI